MVFYILTNSVFTQCSTMNTHGHFRNISDFSSSSLHGDHQCLYDFVELTPVSDSRSLTLKPQDLIIMDFKSCIACYSLIQPKRTKNVAIFTTKLYFYPGLLLLTDDRQQPAQLGIGILGYFSRALSFLITVISGSSGFLPTTPHSRTNMEQFWQHQEKPFFSKAL